jgi:hypothetical protein
LIAQRCLYGLDKNQMAADLAKLSLWLATLAKDHPFTFLDHSLRHGDGLVGLTRHQIATFHWLDQQSVLLDLERELSRRIERVSDYRHRILAARDNVPYSQLKQALDNAEESLGLSRKVGDAIVAAFFAAEKPKDREKKRAEFAELTETALNDSTSSAWDVLETAIGDLRRGPKGICPFHWELEFPEVFTADDKGNVTGGFDVIVGNPPFAGKNTLIDSHADRYLPWLQMIHAESHGNSDLVAHFFRRSFVLLRANGRFGLIATNTIGQGDTRSTGLRWICAHGGTIYRARKRMKWPGEAAVVVSVIHVCKGEVAPPFLLDGRQVQAITAYLFHAGGNDDAARLRANESKSFEGVKIYGMGFTFDSAATNSTATPIVEMERLLVKNPSNRERIFPYLGGEEVNDSPTHEHKRYVIDFEDWPLKRDDLEMSWKDADEDQREEFRRTGVVPLDYPGPVASDWPDLLEIVERNVKPDRLRDNRENYRRLWWQFGERRPGLRAALRTAEATFALCRHSPNLGVVRLPAKIVGADSLDFIVLDRWSEFAVLQSRIHEAWARFQGSSIKDDLRYTPTDCFETFPFPLATRANVVLERAGSAYYEHRATLMQAHNKGLTSIYNLFHDPNCDDNDVVLLRQLHDRMDRAVLDSFAWNDIQPNCQFFAEFDDEDDEDQDDRPRKKKYRYRWPDEIRDDVLARLLALNRKRALEEGQILPDLETPATTNGSKTRKKKSKVSDTTNQIPIELGES